MKIQEATIKNFRSIDGEGIKIAFNDLSIVIGDNGTSKTTILEAVNYCLSSNYLNGKIKPSDFYNGGDEKIEIIVKLDEQFSVSLPDNYTSRDIKCNQIVLKVHKRDRAAAGKAFCDTVVIEHYVLPVQDRNESGWEITRANGSKFKFNERLLSFPIDSNDFPRSFYFAKNREQQIRKGYNSSISSVMEDLNWRFLKHDRSKPADDKFSKRKSDFETIITSNTDGDTIAKTFDSLNAKLVAMELPTADISFIDANAPYDSMFLSKKSPGLDLQISALGSGIEMIVSVLFLETIASLTREKIIVLIDEPELHLHPSLQEKFIRYLAVLTKDSQIILSTHSPYFFKNVLENNEAGLLVATKTGDEKIVVEDCRQIGFGLFPWSPSWGEINYRAYNLCTIEFHNELYGYIQEKEGKYTEEEVENFFVSKSATRSKQWVRLNNGSAEPARGVTLMTFIRNTIHHPENRNNSDFTQPELKSSIKKMIELAV